jgi:hypothetical protein
MLRMSVYMHSRFVENHPIQILEDGPLISEVVLSHICGGDGCGSQHCYLRRTAGCFNRNQAATHVFCQRDLKRRFKDRIRRPERGE